ncbi:hypothetical protein RX330_09925 [Bradyrhizobium sp. NDS-1]|uniref:hypothetical protein n=1 Tax=unclassified Bradyrhizobium TaxID=2631580 RepID=UPI001911E571|nr:MULTISPECIES: hypothetical protein [Bradyrhizobium]WOH75413.1 hypothetical protein RX330_09925 [Bradyrhizobium sp. NDS-1]
MALRDRSSRPHSSPSQTPPATCAAVETLHRQRHSGNQIDAEIEVSPATISRIFRRLGLGRIRDLEPAEPVRRYEREHPGELIHMDIKKLGSFVRPGHRITHEANGLLTIQRRGLGKTNIYELYLTETSRTKMSGPERYVRSDMAQTKMSAPQLMRPDE